jgi:ribonuclease Y
MAAIEWILTGGATCAAGVATMFVMARKQALAASVDLERARAHSKAEGQRAADAARQRVLEEGRARVEQLRREAAEELERREQALAAEDQRLESRTSTLERLREETEAKAQELDGAFDALDARSETLRERRAEAEGIERQVAGLIETHAGITRTDLRAELAAGAVDEAGLAAQKVARLREDHARAEAETAARGLIDVVCQRYGTALPTERLVNSVTLPPAGKLRDRLVGEGGGLLQVLHATTGVEFQTQTDGETLFLAAEEPYLRELGRLTYEKLVKEREPNEASVKRLYDKTTADLDKVVRTAGQKAADLLKVGKVHPEILMLVGKLLYRTSYTQNQWAHAIETAYLCGMMAEDLGVDARAARRSALIHDIGKVLWAETEAVGSHAVSGAAFARAHGESPEIVHPIAAHHNDEKPDSVLAHIVAAADALSGARPGARRATEEAYSMRIEDLERICLSIRGIDSHFVIQGGRELRIVVDQERVDDAGAIRLSTEVAGRIEDELTYPGQIKVTVIRETRASAVAR